MWVIGGLGVAGGCSRVEGWWECGGISIEGGSGLGLRVEEMLLWLFGGVGDVWLRLGEAKVDTGAASRRRNAERPFGGGRPYILICMSYRGRVRRRIRRGGGGKNVPL